MCRFRKKKNQVHCKNTKKKVYPYIKHYKKKKNERTTTCWEKKKRKEKKTRSKPNTAKQFGQLVAHVLLPLNVFCI